MSSCTEVKAQVHHGQEKPPPLSDLSRWFDYHDRDHSGSLDREEVVAALCQTPPFDQLGAETVRETVYVNWLSYDHDMNGVIDKHEFCEPGALGDSLAQANYGYEKPPPLSDLSLWFDYHDRDRSGSLDREEVVAALCQTPSFDQLGAEAIRGIVYVNWLSYDHDMNGVIDKREFCEPGALGDSLVAITGQQSRRHPQADSS